MDLSSVFQSFLKEDLGNGDHSSLACIPNEKKGIASLLVKETGVIAGLNYIAPIFKLLDPETELQLFAANGDWIEKNTVVAKVEAKVIALLSGERLMLNLLQRMSGIATKTKYYSELIAPYGAKLLDTRKTAPGLRSFDKEAVKIGGGINHRMGLYDMIMIKDNHIDYAGGISKAIENCERYIQQKQLDIKIEVEARNLTEVEEILKFDGAFRIMLDNFSYADMRTAVALIGSKAETEASGGITEQNIVEYAKTGVNYISVGALTHAVKSLDISFKEGDLC